MSDKPIRESPRQHQVFLAYAQMPDPSARKLWEGWREIGGLSGYKRPSHRTLERWCSKYQWVERAKQIHNKAKDVAIQKTVEELALTKEEILSMLRAGMLRFGQQLQANTQGIISVADFEKLWKMMRIEMGLPVEISKQKVEVDHYEGVSDEELVKELESLTERYKEKLRLKN